MTGKRQSSLTEINISHKGIVHERFEDAPFIGALIIANQCTRSCKGCFNQHLKQSPPLTHTAEELVWLVKQNPLHEGIILGGLEWTNQPVEMLTLIKTALLHELDLILYTYFEEAVFAHKFPEVYSLPIYIKFGDYRSDLPPYTCPLTGVRLASSNQHIRKGEQHNDKRN